MPLETFDLAQGSTVATIAPTRGALATRLRVGGRDLFYLDEATLLDETKNVRGGCPVLFPSPGKLENDHWARSGREGSLKQHGFARNLAWTIDAKDDASATLVLASSATTRAVYPWDFRAKLRYSVREGALRIQQEVTNTTAPSEPSRMPFGFGFHPYFAVPSAAKREARITTRAWDNTTKHETAQPFALDLTAAEVDLHLLDHRGTALTLEADGGAIEVRGSADYTHWVVWTVQGKDFVCLEPWTCPGNALNTGERLIELASGETRSLWIEIARRA